jgi:sulfur-carrier protein
MAIVWIPSLLRDLTGGEDSIELTAADVGGLVDALDLRFPGVKSRLCQGDQLRPGLAVAVDTKLARLGLSEPLSEESEVFFLPAIGGG